MAGKTTAKAAPTSLLLTFTNEKDTKNTRRFKEDHDGDGRPAIGTLYITTEALAAAGLADANSLTVTVEAND